MAMVSLVGGVFCGLVRVPSVAPTVGAQTTCRVLGPCAGGYHTPE
jgi:hypothetical protein